MKILLIGNYVKGGGGISVQIDLLHKFLNSEEDYSADIFSLKASVFKRICLFFSLLKSAYKYDSLHIHGCSNWGFLPIVYGVIIGRIFSKKTIVTYHGGGAEAFFKSNTTIVKFFLKQADVVIVLSGFLKKIFDNYNISNIVIPNILEFRDNQYVKRRSISPKYISIRSLSQIYNIKCILKAFKIVISKYEDATLTLLGDGDQKEELKRFVTENQIKNVFFLGSVPNSEVYSHLNIADILVSSPLIDNMPVSLLEAFNAGLLVISSRVGGVPYMVSEAITGYMFETDNENELAAKMILGVSNPQKTLSIIANAKADVSKYNWKSVKQSLLNCYKK